MNIESQRGGQGVAEGEANLHNPATRTGMDKSNERQAPYKVNADAAIPSDWLAEFEAAARRPLATRFRYAFIHTYKPVLDDARYRSFDTLADYRAWCDANLPS